jgi:hypothetical protein
MITIGYAALGLGPPSAGRYRSAGAPPSSNVKPIATAQDLHRTSSREMRGDYQRVLFHSGFQQARASSAGLVRLLIETRSLIRVDHLQGAMEQIAHEHSPVGSRTQP